MYSKTRLTVLLAIGMIAIVASAMYTWRLKTRESAEIAARQEAEARRLIANTLVDQALDEAVQSHGRELFVWLKAGDQTAIEQAYVVDCPKQLEVALSCRQLLGDIERISVSNASSPSWAHTRYIALYEQTDDLTQFSKDARQHLFDLRDRFTIHIDGTGPERPVHMEVQIGKRENDERLHLEHISI